MGFKYLNSIKVVSVKHLSEHDKHGDGEDSSHNLSQIHAHFLLLLLLLTLSLSLSLSKWVLKGFTEIEEN